MRAQQRSDKQPGPKPCPPLPWRRGLRRYPPSGHRQSRDRGGAVAAFLIGRPGDKKWCGTLPHAEWKAAKWSRRTLLVDGGWNPAALTPLAREVKADPQLRGVRVIALLPPGERAAGESLHAAGFDHWLARPVREHRLLALLTGQTSPARTFESVMRLSPARILIADDNPVNRAVARSMIEKLGSEVQTVTDGNEAIAAIAWTDATAPTSCRSRS